MDTLKFLLTPFFFVLLFFVVFCCFCCFFFQLANENLKQSRLQVYVN